MKHGEKALGLNVKKLLSSLHGIFDESPARRADYEALTKAISLDHPLQFCAHRWVENERLAVKAREICPKIVEIIEGQDRKGTSQEKERLEQGPVMIILFRFRRTH